MKEPLHIRLIAPLASLRLTVVGLLLLTVLTLWGTLYQAEHGLYQAQERFYESWVFLVADALPFPGGQLVMSVLFANLGAAVLLMALRRRLTIGFALIHLGLILLLAAGAATYYWGREAHLTLAEGGAANVAVSDEDWELALLPADAPPRRKVVALDAADLRAGQRLPVPGSDATFRIERFYRNCEPQKGETAQPPLSVSGATTLVRKPAEREPARNFPGAVIAVERDGRTLARVLVWGGDEVPVVADLGNGPRAIGLRRQRLPLPATIELVDFRQELHPGSGIAKSYSSQVKVSTAGDMSRPVLIAMNKPLRVHGFTFYQSSFSSAPRLGELSTFAVVENRGRLVPYIATGLTFAGLCLYFGALLACRLTHVRPETRS